jgi:hypothetical protein
MNPEIVWAAVAAVAAVIAVAVAGLSWLEARRTRLETVETGRRQTRAYLYARACRLTFDRPGLAPSGATIVLVNAGQTPPLAYRIEASFELLAPRSAERLAACTFDAEFVRRPVSIAPGGEAEFEGLFTDAFADKAQALMEHGRPPMADIRCRGYVRYTDVYGAAFESPFEFRCGVVFREGAGLAQTGLALSAGDPFQPVARAARAVFGEKRKTAPADDPTRSEKAERAQPE